MLKGVRNPHNHDKMRNSILIIIIKKSSDERVTGPLGVNISDGLGKVMAPGLKDLELVDNNSLSRGSGWRQFVGPQCPLEKVGHSICVWQLRCLKPDGECGSPEVC